MTDPCPRPDCAAVRAELAEARARTTLGGIPPRPVQDWANETLAAPASASDPSAPALRRQGLRNSRSAG